MTDDRHGRRVRAHCYQGVRCSTLVVDRAIYLAQDPFDLPPENAVIS